ncbi:MAG: hypothetical protein AAGD38_07425 [Acidobacteriota bacterium]
MSPSNNESCPEPNLYVENAFVGSWAYRSLLNDTDLDKPFNDLQFGKGTIVIESGPAQTLRGTIGGPGWELTLYGSREYGSPMRARFQGKGMVGGEEWIYDYVCWLVPNWPNSNPRLQRPALVGSVIRTIPHRSSSGGVSPAGVTASFYAVRMDD